MRQPLGPVPRRAVRLAREHEHRCIGRAVVGGELHEQRAGDGERGLTIADDADHAVVGERQPHRCLGDGSMTVEHDHEVGIGRSGRRPVERRIPRHGAEPDSQAQEVCVPRPPLPHTRRRRGRPARHLGRVRQRRQQPGALPRRGAAEIAVELSELVPVAGRLLALRAGMAAPLRDLVHAHHQRAHDGDQQERRVRPVEGVEGGAGGERGEQHHDVERRFAAPPVRRVRRA